MADWSLDLAGARKTLAQWGLGAGIVRYRNLALDEFSIVRDGSNFDADPLCAFEATAKLYNPAGTKIFEGLRLLTPGQADGPQESQAYTFAGPWRWLEQNLYKQLWTGGIGGVLTTLYTSHIIQVGTGTQLITSALQYAIASGAPLQIGTIDIPVSPPISEIVDRTCATVILDVLQYAPDAVGWFDYSTSPPTFHCKQRQKRDGSGVLVFNLPRVSVSIPPAVTQDLVNVSVISPITARPDRQVPSVELNYEITSTIDGQQVFSFSRDVWPPGATGRENRALSSVVNLQGFSATHVRGTLQAEAINTASLDWWKKVFPKLADPRVRNLAFSTGAAAALQRIGTDGTPSLGLPNRMLPEGSGAADWMVNPNGSAVDWQEEQFTIQFDFDFHETEAPTSTRISSLKNERFTVTLLTTNAPVGETPYSALETFEAGDPVPVGLAKFLFDSFSTLHYDVALKLVENECAGTVTVGQLINLVGSRPEYEAMNAIVQEVTIDIDGGGTDIVAGPPRQLALDDVLELLRANRARRRWTNPNTQNTGELSGPSNVELGRATSSTNSVPGHSVAQLQVIKQGNNKITLDTRPVNVPADTGFKIVMDAGGAQKLLIDFANADWTAAPQKQLKVKRVTVCERNSQGISEEKYMLVLGSDTWGI